MSSTNASDPHLLTDTRPEGVRRFSREGALRAIAVVLLILLLLIVSLQVWGIALWEGSIDPQRFGNWGEVISGFGTTAAMTVAVISLLNERALRRKTDRDEIIQAEAAVYVWLTFADLVDDNGKLLRRMWTLRIQNITSAPIYHWQAIFKSEHEHMCGFNTRPILPGENVFNLLVLDNFAPSAVPKVDLIFVARSGEVWRRTGDGKLTSETPRAIVCEHWPLRSSGSGPSP